MRHDSHRWRVQSSFGREVEPPTHHECELELVRQARRAFADGRSCAGCRPRRVLPLCQHRLRFGQGKHVLASGFDGAQGSGVGTSWTWEMSDLSP